MHYKHQSELKFSCVIDTYYIVSLKDNVAFKSLMVLKTGDLGNSNSVGYLFVWYN